MSPQDQLAAQFIPMLPDPSAPDTGVQEVADWFNAHPGMEEKFGSCFRQAIDEVLDGQRTGRFDITSREVASTEKTYLGTKVEIIVRSAFGLPHGQRMDYQVTGHDVDAKWTIYSNWTIPKEADGHICLLMKADDHRSTFSVGLLRIEDAYLNTGENRDSKRSVSAAGRAATKWLVINGQLPRNALLALTPAEQAAVFSSRSGQARTNELFRRVHGQIVNRNTVLTVARQDDSPKRVRDARKHLAKEGIIILGHQGRHPLAARDLGLPVPRKGEWTAVRITAVPETSSRRKTLLSGTYYAVADAGESSPAPSSY
ncbi:NaeI family type II restriction endonuclease [Streptomyces chrestomyceticus]|uniref:NaeI family type II restriction endonuclease n=1 Tax=Streptomyces chrestomyceticus TaxID=68185 RepID=UPI00340EE553